jgi:hypothetical protein
MAKELAKVNNSGTSANDLHGKTSLEGLARFSGFIVVCQCCLVDTCQTSNGLATFQPWPLFRPSEPSPPSYNDLNPMHNPLWSSSSHTIQRENLQRRCGRKLHTILCCRCDRQRQQAVLIPPIPREPDLRSSADLLWQTLLFRHSHLDGIKE